ncbi:MAG: MBL fold metallo-hydrolase [Anaerolineales bacterium]|nr:MBL fold metallo-hydrolase [Anaerolineales bacterium]
MDGNIYPFALGDFRCVIINDGTETYPITALTTDASESVLSRELASQGLPSDELVVNYNCMLLRSDDFHVLIDAGWGQDTQRRNGELIHNLNYLDVGPDDIDVIVITHIDGDHIGGIISPQGELTFTNAKYITWQSTLASWRETQALDLPQEIADYRIKCLELIRNRVEVANSESDFMTGFRIIPAIGHRPGHAALFIASQGEQLIHVADAIPHPILIDHQEWRWPYHSFPEEASQNKIQLLNVAVKTDALVFGSHFPFPGLGKVSLEKDNYRWKPISNL